VDGGSLDITGTTLTGGKTSGRGGAIQVANSGSLTLNASALLGNEAQSFGGAISISSTAGSVSITDSVITANTAMSGGGGIRNDKAGVTVGNTIWAKNVSVSNRHDVFATGTGTFISLGNNMLTENSSSTPGFNGDFVGAVNYVVTSIADTINHKDDAVALSVREAVDSANSTTGAEEIWLPAWDFALTLKRNGQQYDTTAEYGDLDVDDSLTIRGINGETSVDWHTSMPADKVFELLGDYDNDGFTD
jgi:hypothetical protein